MLTLLMEAPEITAPAVRELVTELPGFLWCTHYSNCAQCDEPTTWMDLDFECPTHPGACSQKMWDDFRWAQTFAWMKSQDYQDFLAKAFNGRTVVDSTRIDFLPTINDMRCPNKDCRPPNYCGLCKGTGQIPD